MLWRAAGRCTHGWRPAGSRTLPPMPGNGRMHAVGVRAIAVAPAWLRRRGSRGPSWRQRQRVAPRDQHARGVALGYGDRVDHRRDVRGHRGEADASDGRRSRLGLRGQQPRQAAGGHRCPAAATDDRRNVRRETTRCSISSASLRVRGRVAAGGEGRIVAGVSG